MNIKLFVVSGIALLTTSAAFAEPLEYVDFSNFVSTKSRAEVVAELEAARADGMTLQSLDTQYPPIARLPGAQRSRQEVVSELKQFRALNPNFNSEVSYPEVFQGLTSRQRVAGMETPSSPRQ